MGYIYKITNSVNEFVYIGQTKRSIETRWNEHRTDALSGKAHTCTFLHSAIRKYGINNFYIEEVEQCDDHLLDDRERYWIWFYGSFDRSVGYNLTDGGSAGRTQIPDSDETRKKKSLSQLGNKNSFWGKKHTAQHIASISTPIVSYTDDGEIYCYYLSQSVTNKYGFAQSHIANVLSGANKHHGKTHDGQKLCWRYADDFESSIIKSHFLLHNVESVSARHYQDIVEVHNYG